MHLACDRVKNVSAQMLLDAPRCIQLRLASTTSLPIADSKAIKLRVKNVHLEKKIPAQQHSREEPKDWLTKTSGCVQFDTLTPLTVMKTRRAPICHFNKAPYVACNNYLLQYIKYQRKLIYAFSVHQSTIYSYISSQFTCVFV